MTLKHLEAACNTCIFSLTTCSVLSIFEDTRKCSMEQVSMSLQHIIVCTLKEDQHLRLLLNLLFYHFNRSEPTYKSQHIKLPDGIATCNQLNVDTLYKILITIFSWGRSHKLYPVESRFLISVN